VKNTTKGFLAGAAGLGLILGGSTFALWTDDADLSSERITAGNLEVKVNEANWKDMSKDRTDRGWRGHDIDLESFRIIPGDKIQARYPISVGLEGENMVAKLHLATKGKKGGAEGELAEGLDISYEVLDSRGKPVSRGDHKGAEVTLASEDNGNARGLVRVDAEPGKKADFYVVVTVEFDEDTDERDLVETQATLADAEIELKQVRKGVPGYYGGKR